MTPCGGGPAALQFMAPIRVPILEVYMTHVVGWFFPQLALACCPLVNNNARAFCSARATVGLELTAKS